MRKKGKQTAYKPDSVRRDPHRGESHARLPFIYGKASPPASIVLPSSSDGPPSNAGIHELSTSGVHSTKCHHWPGGLLPRLLTLTSSPSLTSLRGGNTGRRSFSSALADPRGPLPVRKRNCPSLPGLSSRLPPLPSGDRGKPATSRQSAFLFAITAKIRQSLSPRNRIPLIHTAPRCRCSFRLAFPALPSAPSCLSSPLFRPMPEAAPRRGVPPGVAIPTISPCDHPLRGYMAPRRGAI